MEGLKGVDRVIECHEPQAISYLRRFDVSVYVVTEEWKEQQQEAIEWINARKGLVIYSPRFPDIFDTTTIRNRVKESK